MPQSTKYRTVLLFGGPGCGKGTQGVVLGAFPNMVHVSSGDIFRGLSPQSTLGQEFRSISAKGLLVPDELTVRMWVRHMQGLEHLERFVPEYHTLISDGIPRTARQAELLGAHLEVLKILKFEMPQDKLVQRLKGRAFKENRADDANEEVIRKRLQVYDESTTPVLNQYPEDLVARINADQTVLEVARDTSAALIGYVPTQI